MLSCMFKNGEPGKQENKWMSKNMIARNCFL